MKEDCILNCVSHFIINKNIYHHDNMVTLTNGLFLGPVLPLRNPSGIAAEYIIADSFYETRLLWHSLPENSFVVRYILPFQKKCLYHISNGILFY